MPLVSASLSGVSLVQPFAAQPDCTGFIGSAIAAASELVRLARDTDRRSAYRGRSEASPAVQFAPTRSFIPVNLFAPFAPFAPFSLPFRSVRDLSTRSWDWVPPVPPVAPHFSAHLPSICTIFPACDDVNPPSPARIIFQGLRTTRIPSTTQRRLIPIVQFPTIQRFRT
jgi:hypothetical protein